MRRSVTVYSDWERECCCRSGAVTTVLGPQLGVSWGGACARGAVEGGRQIASRTPFAHGSTWGGEGGKISSRLGDRSGVFHMPVVLH
jgi:hypothetical protein